MSRSGDNYRCKTAQAETTVVVAATAAVGTAELVQANICTQLYENMSASRPAMGLDLRDMGELQPVDAPDSSHQEYNKPEGIIGKLLKMAGRKYVTTLLCLSLILVATLIATVAISRTIGGLDLDSDNSKEGVTRMSPAESQTAELVPMEVREFDLIDLVECDKTFAYVRWRVRVRVPHTTPNYKQQEQQAAIAIVRQARQVENGAKNIEDKPSQSQESSQFQLTGTREFVSGQQHERDFLTALAVDKELQSNSSTREGNQELRPVGGTSGRIPIELADPLEIAASEMGVERAEMNRTLADCFLVDVQKRPEQKLKLEREHERFVSTRAVAFKSMLVAIQDCRELSMKGLSPPNQASVGANMRPHDQERAGRRVGRDTTSPKSASGNVGNDADGVPSASLIANQSSQVGAERERPTSDRFLNEVIKPSGRVALASAQESTGRAQSSNNKNPFGSLIEILVANWSSLSSSRPSASHSLLESRQASNMVGSSAPKIGLFLDQNRPATSAPIRPLPPSPPSFPLIPANTATANEDGNEEAQRRTSYLNMGMSMMSGIVPNTLWCGLGDRAANYSELGAELQIDACCRAHDHCPIRLRPFAADYNLINWSMSTRSHCDCDLDFSDCLTNVNSTLSNVIKTLYFRFIGLQCIDLGLASRNVIQEPV